MTTVYTLNEDVARAVQSLVQMNEDAAEGFTKASEVVDDPELAGMFRTAALERRRLRDECEAILEGSSEPVPDGGTVVGMAHRWWMDLRGRLTGEESKALLQEVDRGEAALLTAYEEAAARSDIAELDDMLERHIESVRTTRDRMNALESSSN